MDLFEGIIEGLKEALAHARGEQKCQEKLIGHCPKCRHHLNFSESELAWCPLCDEYFKPEDCRK